MGSVNVGLNTGFLNNGVRAVGAVNLNFSKLKPYLECGVNHWVAGKARGVSCHRAGQ